MSRNSKIIVPGRDSIVVPPKLPHRMKARFKLARVKASSGLVVEETSWFSNLLLNNFFDDMLSTRENFWSGFVVGAGTSSPAETDTSLQSYVGGGAFCEEVWTTKNSTVSPRFVTYGMRFRSTEGGAQGNLSEVGMYTGAANNSRTNPSSSVRLYSRARIKDEMGNPTSITVLGDEFLDVYYELTVFALEDVEGTMTINVDGVPSDFDYTLRSVGMENTSLWSDGYKIGDLSCMSLSNMTMGFATSNTFGNYGNLRADAATSLLGYNSTGFPSVLSNGVFVYRDQGSYTSGAKTRVNNYRLPLNNGNVVSGIPSLFLSNNRNGVSHMQHQLLFDTRVPKVATKLWDLPVRVTLANG